MYGKHDFLYLTKGNIHVNVSLIEMYFPIPVYSLFQLAYLIFCLHSVIVSSLV